MGSDRSIFGFLKNLCLQCVLIVLTATAVPAQTAQIFGMADLHNHQFANLGFGGQMVVGAPFSDTAGGIADALPWCTQQHDLGGVGDILTDLLNESLGHRVGGWPQFDGWPRWNSLTHQQVYHEWLKRGLDGGLKLIVMLAVSNKALCEVWYQPAPGFTCNDMNAVDKQIAGAYTLQTYIDNESGGPGLGWYRIVTSPAQARQVIDSGKLAVVLGIEVDTLFDCGANGSCTKEYVDAKLDEYYQKGVRHVFPVHLVNNGFGGPALYNDFFNALNVYETGAFYEPYDCAPDYMFELFNPGAAVDPRLFDFIGVGPLPEYPHRAHCNTRGLSPAGEALVTGMMDRKMIIDIDHMSLNAANRAMELVEARDYPVVAGHTGVLGTSKGEHRSEAQKTDLMLDRIRNVDGLVGLILNQGTREETEDAGSPVANSCGGSSRSWAQAYLYTARKMDAVAIGTDINGMVRQPAPRYGSEACNGDLARPQYDLDRIPYPFTAETGVGMAMSQIGGRPYIDILHPYVPPQVFDYNEDGMAHIGMLPDFVEDLKHVGMRPEDLAPLFKSAEAYVHLWEKIEAADLSVNTVSSAVTAVFGGNLGVYDWVNNTGRSGTGANAIVRFYLSTGPGRTGTVIPIGQRVVPALAAMHGSDAATSLTIPDSAAYVETNYHLTACVNDPAVVFEANERNNCTGAAETVLVRKPSALRCYQDLDADGWEGPGPDYDSCLLPKPLTKLDCDDNDPSRNQGAAEVCNGRDDNCNLRVDEWLPTATYYQDKDLDGFGNPASSMFSCAQPAGYVADNTDCDDNEPKMHPAAFEVCGNEFDENCDGKKSEVVQYYLDSDGDGYGGRDGTTNTKCLDRPAGYVLNNLDCNDKTVAAHPGSPETCDGQDNNCNGATDEGFDGDGDGWTVCGGDCDDANPYVHPGFPEACNGADDNCNGTADEDLATATYYRDGDGDGYGSPAAPVSSCRRNPGTATDNTDCVDSDRFVHPGMFESCSNGKDDDCDGKVDEATEYFRDDDGDGYGNPELPKLACTNLTTEGHVTNKRDCNDKNNAVNPGSAEICDTLDNDCDTLIDEGFDVDADGVTVCTGDCNDVNPFVYPGATETCNGIDDNCSGAIDEGVTVTYFADADGDGYGSAAGSVEACEPPVGYAANAGDCDDGNASVNPAATEVPANLLDDNCNGFVDEASRRFVSVAASDGWVLESGETTRRGGTTNSAGAVLNVGDDALDRQGRAILSFNTTGLPDNAVVVGLTLRVKRSKLVGTDPSATHGAFLVDVRKGSFGSSLLEPTDFQSAAGKPGVGTFPALPSGGWYSVQFGSGAFAFVNTTGVTQFRLRFSKDDNDDRGADALLLHSGNAAAAADRPELIVEYTAP